uniref:Uncharacterized protein n=1 Tax=Nelumbo nucifera TaxID=4432 RepID=A0A823A3M0_NELNU|nr:TPA_asm: hypothetical protein HUJ06_018575 [Nelumbo nucifera]
MYPFLKCPLFWRLPTSAHSSCPSIFDHLVMLPNHSRIYSKKETFVENDSSSVKIGLHMKPKQLDPTPEHGRLIWKEEEDEEENDSAALLPYLARGCFGDGRWFGVLHCLQSLSAMALCLTRVGNEGGIFVKNKKKINHKPEWESHSFGGLGMAIPPYGGFPFRLEWEWDSHSSQSTSHN